ncbi:MAG TPA: hypothetical protein VFP25_01905 [Nitrososphaeraceae archaeon]|nr:hypothetical protein [Nitrososphaeraceae archaeon]
MKAMRREHIIFVLMEKVIVKYVSIEYVLKKQGADAVRTSFAASVVKIITILRGDGRRKQEQLVLD